MSFETLRPLRDAFGAFMTGVTVVTTHDSTGAPLGFTANSFSSVSLDPPLLLISIAKSSMNHAAVTGAKGFAVNILADSQKDISNTFARPVADRFASVAWQRGPYGSPVLADVSAWFDCALHQLVDAGDHTILIGRVEGFGASSAPGLGYYRGAYFTSAQEVAAVAGPEVVISALIEHNGEVLLMDDGQGGLMLLSCRVGREGVTTALSQLIEQSGVAASPGFVYSVYDDKARGYQNISFLCHSSGGNPKRGIFTALIPSTLNDVTDPAQQVMLERLAEESRVGNYGIYFGNQNTGQVRQVTKELGA